MFLSKIGGTFPPFAFSLPTFARLSDAFQSWTHPPLGGQAIAGLVGSLASAPKIVQRSALVIVTLLLQIRCQLV
jgi:hypothetical protein